MRLSVLKFLILFVAVSLVILGPAGVQAQSSIMKDPKVRALVEVRLAKVRQLSDEELDRAAERNRATTDANFNELSKKDVRRLARLGDAVWLDCAKIATFGAEEAKTRDLSDKMNLSRVYDELMRAVFYNQMRAKLVDHGKYRVNGIDFEAAKSQAGAKNWQLFVASRGLKCQLSLIDVNLSGEYENAFVFYGKSSSAADLYRKSEAN